MTEQTVQAVQRQDEAAILETITRTIVERFHPRRIVLFGSRARGEGTEDSDYDVFVEMESELSLPLRAIEVDRALDFRTWPLDVLVYTPEEVARHLTDRGSLIPTIEAEGRLLYARP